MIFRPLISAGLLAALTFGTAHPASAVTFRVTHGKNVATVSSDHKKVTLCDGEDDKNAVQVQYVRASGSSGAFWEKRGRGACSTSGAGSTVLRMKLCEQLRGGGNNCTDWQTNPSVTGTHVGSSEAHEDLDGEVPPSHIPDTVGPLRPVPRTGE